jgi:hypothetical protein
VKREGFATLGEAIEALERGARAIRGEGPLEEVSVLRDFGPGDRVHARLDLSAGSLIRGREAGIDVMGDGRLVPYTGVVRKRRLEPRNGETAFDVVREALA